MIKIAFIYLIENMENNKKYVGQTRKNVIARYCQHIESAFRTANKKRNDFYRDIVESGDNALNVFNVQTIEECDDSIKLEREKYWIKFYKCEYNEQFKIAYLQNIEKEIVREYESGNTMESIYTKYQCRHDTIKDILIKNNVELRKYQSIGKKKIFEYDDNGDIRNIFENAQQCANYYDNNIDRSNVRLCSLKNKETKTIRYSASGKYFSYSYDIPQNLCVIKKDGIEYSFKTIKSFKEFIKQKISKKAKYGYFIRVYLNKDNRKKCYGYEIIYVNDILIKEK